MKKKVFITVVGMLMAVIAYSQTVPPGTEDFDGTVSFTASPTGSWVSNSLYYHPNSSTTNPKSYLGFVPASFGDTSILLTQTYDCSPYDYVFLKFSHICKVSPLDTVRIDYRTNVGGGMSSWKPLPAATYQGEAFNYSMHGFSAASYADWQANDSTVFPAQSWWKDELFDLWFEAGKTQIQFRFIIIRGNVQGTDLSYGWLIDNFELSASVNQLYLPEVEFLAPILKDTVFGTGPWEINAKVASKTNAPILPPFLVYTATNNVISETDTLLMTSKGGDLWQVDIPQFEIGTTITYSITGEDTNGNYLTKTLSYIVAVGGIPPVIVGTGRVEVWPYPVNLINTTGWSRQLYLASELGTSRIGTYIDSLQWEIILRSPLTAANQKCYLLATNDMVETTGYDDPSTLSGAVKVFDGTLTLTNGWTNVPFSQPFYLPAGKNLRVFWEDQSGRMITPGGISSPDRFYHHATSFNSSYYNPGASEPTLAAQRPNARFIFTTSIPDHSAMIYSIDIKDTIVVSSGLQIPVAFTVKNQGRTNLTSASIGYSVNGNIFPSKSWTGNLSWNMNQKDTIGVYNPKLNGYDTIKVWIKMPNGNPDNITVDDTMTMLIYGSSDILMTFVDYPEDTVYKTGPFPVSARINTISGATVNAVSLYIVRTYNGTQTSTNLSMTYDGADKLWKTSIPQTRFESDVTYSITLTDALTNVVKKEGKFYIQQLAGGASTNVVFGTGTVQDATTPIYMEWPWNWSKQLYLESEILDGGLKGGIITKLAWDYAGCTGKNCGGDPFDRFDQTCYFRLVDDADLSDKNWMNYDDPAKTPGMIQVWQTPAKTPLSATSAGWVEVTLDNPFVWTKGKNLLIYWHNNDAGSGAKTYGSDLKWNHTTMGKSIMVIHNPSNKYFPDNMAYSYSIDRPNVRLLIETTSNPEMSVAMVAIESPLSSGLVGQSVPVRVKIQNKGLKDLNNCTISWTKNGIMQGNKKWQGTLPAEFTDTVTIGIFTPQLGKLDTIVVWVTMPNDVPDQGVLTDDTSSIITLSCDGNLLQGDVTVGGTGNPSLSEMLITIKQCGLLGDLTLKLTQGTYNEHIDLTDFMPYLNGYHLTITSLDNNPDKVIIQPNSGASAGITLGNARNITIKAITVNTTATTAHAIQFTSTCSNIVIRGCKLLTKLQNTWDMTAPIHKGYNTGIVDSIFVIKNILDGGHTGFYFYGGTGTGVGEYGTNVVFDSNVVSNSFTFGVGGWYTDFLHISANTLTNGENANGSWYTIYLWNANGDITNNRIKQTNPNREMAGIKLQDYNRYNTTKRALIANNEVIQTEEVSQYVYGIQCISVKADILHNSIYLMAPKTTYVYGIYLDDVSNNNLTIKNNIVVTQGAGGALFSYATNDLSYVNQYDIDYNNFHATGHNLGHVYNGNPFSVITLADFLSNFPTAQHMQSFLPEWINISVNTDVSPNNTGLYCPILPAVVHDINSNLRSVMASMGAYQMTPYTRDLALNQFVSFPAEVVKDQTVSVEVEVQSFGQNPVQNAVLGWSLNGQKQSSFPWTPTTPLPFFEKENVIVGPFTVNSTDDIYDIVVWVESINNATDMHPKNDTIRITNTKISLAEFVEPVVKEDTIDIIAFDVYVKIRTATGAPNVSPQLYITNIIKDKYIVYDSVTMVLDNGVWKASVPQQYYNSKVIYSMIVSDTMGNSITLIDSTYIKFTGFYDNNPAVTIGTGTGIATLNPYTTNSANSFSRNYYMDYEINSNRKGGIIYSIAFYNTTSNNVTTNNLSFYMKVVSDSAQVPMPGQTSPTYIDPIGDGATLVWGPGTYSTNSGWNVFTLSAPFDLPAGQNLLIYCNNQHGSSASPYPYWQYTNVSRYSSCSYASNAWPPAGTGSYTYNGNLPNLQLNIDLAGRGMPYTENNLAVLEILSPVNDPNALCMPDYSLVIANLGENEYDFTQDPATLSIELINPAGEKDTTIININTGTLETGELDTIKLLPSLLINYQGTYNLRLWLTSSLDNRPYDDTLSFDFVSGKISLPVNEDFSAATIPEEFASLAVSGSDIWTPYTDTTSQITPPYGNGMLRYVSSRGSIARLTTRQLDLYGSKDPRMEFWYYHDTTVSELDNSYTTVKVLADDVPTTIQTLYRRSSPHGWQSYTVDLNPFVNAQCVLIQFESMNKYDSTSVQYLGYISITSTLDLEVSDIIVFPEISACDLTQKRIDVVIKTVENQGIDFSRIPTSLAIEIQGQSLPPVPLEGVLSGNSTKTVTVADSIDLTNVNSIKVYLIDTVDKYPSNDTATRIINVKPELSVTMTQLTGGLSGTNCLKIGSIIYPELTITNTGNIDLSGIELLLRITGDNTSEVIKEEGSINLQADSSRSYTFTNTYNVPEEATYQVQLTAYLGCDSVRVNDNVVVYECVDLDNIIILSIDNPVEGQTTVIGSQKQITATIKNESIIKTYSDVSVNALIEDENGQMLGIRMFTVSELEPLATQQITFSEPYTVPNDSVYYIRVYLNNEDLYPEDDTAKIECYTESVDIKSFGSTNAFTLSQNIPNPASNTTRIDYSVPEAGGVIFHVHSISGQLLYSKTIEVSGGTNSIELNTSTFAAGVYFYSMEYKGQRLVKQLIIHN